MGIQEILTTEGVVPEVWEAEASAEYLRQSFWMRFGGKGDNAVITMNEDLTKASGDAINTSIRSQLQGGVITGSTPTTGNEGHMFLYNFRLAVDDDKVAGKWKNFPMTQQRTAVKILNSLRSGIVDARRLRTDDRITSALTDTSSGRVQGRYRYGSAESNYDATAATAKTNIDNTDDQLKLSDVSALKRKAKVIGGNAQAKIRPYKVVVGESDGVAEYFLYVNHDYAIRDLTQNDAAWKNPLLLLPPMMNAKSPIFTGASFKGGWDGVLIYEWEGIPLENSTIQISHGLFLGAQACVVAWAQHGKFTEEYTNYKKDIGLEHHEINAIGKVVYDRNSQDGSTNEDQGVIHHYTPAVAD